MDIELFSTYTGIFFLYLLLLILDTSYSHWEEWNIWEIVIILQFLEMNVNLCPQKRKKSIKYVRKI